MKIFQYFLFCAVACIVLNNRATGTPTKTTDLSAGAETPTLDAFSLPVFLNINDWKAQIRTMGSDIIASKIITTPSGVYFVAVTQTGEHSVGICAYDTQSHNMNHIGWSLTDSNGKDLFVKANKLLCRDYTIFTANGSSTYTVAYGSQESINPKYSGDIKLNLNIQRESLRCN